MENLFNFEYEVETLLNKDNSASRFGVVFGQDGNVVHTKKDSYIMIKTKDVETIGSICKDKGYKVSSYIHKHGEVIGLNIDLGPRPTSVGEIQYRLLLNIKNNGSGVGEAFLSELRLVCLNGATRELGKRSFVRIPHSLDYPTALKLVETSILNIESAIKTANTKDLAMSENLIDKIEIIRRLNVWFFENELPVNHKKGFTIDSFREALYETPELIEQSSLRRHTQLMESLTKELKHNTTLNLKPSEYTVFATITNYLSRRQEASQSDAPKEIQDLRLITKTKMLVAS